MMEDTSATQQLEQLVLRTLDTEGEIEDSLAFAQQKQVDHNELVSELNSLAAYELVALKNVLKETTELTEEGEEVIKHGSPEFRLWSLVGEAGVLKADAEKQPYFKSGFGEAMSKKNQWIEFKKETGQLVRKATEVKDHTQERLLQFKQTGAPFDKNEKVVYGKSRKFIRDVKKKSFTISKGAKFTLAGKPKLLLDITSEVLASGAWKEQGCKAYNFDALGQVPASGHLHPLLKVRSAFREIFLEMGFEEMPTNNFVESSFWNFDALFQPQQHPARDAHDTFFLTEPASLLTYPEDFLQRVKEMHENGGSGSIGYRYDWKLEEAKKNILRTHTTAVSTRMLYKLAQEKPFVPKKYFSIDRVYRNETLDSTHLAEFHQIEGLIADYDLTLADLIGVITQFFQKWGMTELRFKPAYNPYTEPSMEIFAFHPGLGKWVEIGNSGMFRPEMLIPMGLDPKVRVIAWGLGLERPTMIRYGIKNIRDLVGHKVSLDFVKQNPLCDIQLEDLYDAKKFLKPTKKD